MKQVKFISYHVWKAYKVKHFSILEVRSDSGNELKVLADLNGHFLYSHLASVGAENQATG